MIICRWSFLVSSSPTLDFHANLFVWKSEGGEGLSNGMGQSANFRKLSSKSVYSVFGEFPQLFFSILARRMNMAEKEGWPGLGLAIAGTGVRPLQIASASDSGSSSRRAPTLQMPPPQGASTAVRGPPSPIVSQDRPIFPSIDPAGRSTPSKEVSFSGDPGDLPGKK